jgi:hypothetical protein
MGISMEMLRTTCRRLGIIRWPHRKLCSLVALQNYVTTCTEMNNKKRLGDDGMMEGRRGQGRFAAD